MALHANFESCGVGSKLVADKRPVRVVTIAALDEPHIDAMTIGPCKFSSLLSVAAIAKHQLRIDEKRGSLFRVMGRVATEASDALRHVCGTAKVRGFGAGLMA
jgi:hypothetical protein